MEAFDYERTCARFQTFCAPQDPITKCINFNGYGRFALFSLAIRAHCAAWKLSNLQDIPKGLVVRHQRYLKNRLCVNEDHLKIGTQQETANNIIASLNNGKTIAE